jgi:hypothetical protein
VIGGVGGPLLGVREFRKFVRVSRHLSRSVSTITLVLREVVQYAITAREARARPAGRALARTWRKSSSTSFAAFCISSAWLSACAGERCMSAACVRGGRRVPLRVLMQRQGASKPGRRCLERVASARGERRTLAAAAWSSSHPAAVFSGSASWSARTARVACAPARGAAQHRRPPPRGAARVGGGGGRCLVKEAREAAALDLPHGPLLCLLCERSHLRPRRLQRARASAPATPGVPRCPRATVACHVSPKA